MCVCVRAHALMCMDAQACAHNRFFEECHGHFSAKQTATDTSHDPSHVYSAPLSLKSEQYSFELGDFYHPSQSMSMSSLSHLQNVF